MADDLHVAAIDYVANPSIDTSNRLIAAAHRASLAELRATGEIVPRSATLLLSQLAEEREDVLLVPACDDDDGVSSETGIIRLPPMRSRVIHTLAAHPDGMTSAELCDLLRATTPGAVAQVGLELRSVLADGIVRSVAGDRYVLAPAIPDAADEF